MILLDRVAPEALGGVSKRYFTDVSYVYELTAPMETVVDMTERDRTEQFAHAAATAEATHQRHSEARKAELRCAIAHRRISRFRIRILRTVPE